MLMVREVGEMVLLTTHNCSSYAAGVCCRVCRCFNELNVPVKLKSLTNDFNTFLRRYCRLSSSLISLQANLLCPFIFCRSSLSFQPQ